MSPLERRIRLLLGLDFPAVEPPPETETETKSRLIREALESESGRQRLAEVMTRPIRERRDYNSLGRQLFPVAPLPEGSPGMHPIYRERYERPVREPVARYLTPEEYGFPMPEEPVRLTDINMPRFDIIEHREALPDSMIESQSLENIQAIEDEEFMRVFDEAVAAHEAQEQEDE